MRSPFSVPRPTGSKAMRRADRFALAARSLDLRDDLGWGDGGAGGAGRAGGGPRWTTGRTVRHGRTFPGAVDEWSASLILPSGRLVSHSGPGVHNVTSHNIRGGEERRRHRPLWDRAARLWTLAGMMRDRDG